MCAALTAGVPPARPGTASGVAWVAPAAPRAPHPPVRRPPARAHSDTSLHGQFLSSVGKPPPPSRAGRRQRAGVFRPRLHDSLPRGPQTRGPARTPRPSVQHLRPPHPWLRCDPGMNEPPGKVYPVSPAVPPVTSWLCSGVQTPTWVSADAFLTAKGSGRRDVAFHPDTGGGGPCPQAFIQGPWFPRGVGDSGGCPPALPPAPPGAQVQRSVWGSSHADRGEAAGVETEVSVRLRDPTGPQQLPGAHPAPGSPPGPRGNTVTEASSAVAAGRGLPRAGSTGVHLPPGQGWPGPGGMGTRGATRAKAWWLTGREGGTWAGEASGHLERSRSPSVGSPAATRQVDVAPSHSWPAPGHS